ncbi:MAG TPA: hypothetical protein VNR18_08395 [Hyphomicrobiales bacterium]|nr:hypothetical protein [Hyphomicrobiales bacterium]
MIPKEALNKGLWWMQRCPKLVVPALVLMLLGGCSSLYTQRTTPAPVEILGPGTPPTDPGTPLPPPGEPSTPGVVVNPAVVTPPPTRQQGAVSPLDTDIRQALAVRDYNRAAALTERALRIRPREAGLWYTLATIRLDQGRDAEALGHAQRALSFSTDTAQRRDIEQLLARLRQ